MIDITSWFDALGIIGAVLFFVGRIVMLVLLLLVDGEAGNDL